MAIKLLQLLWSFMKIGFTSFGGLSMVPLINSEMMDHGWMTLEEVADIVAIAEMTPGPLGLNCATFAGMRVAGIPGALMANLGILAPTLTVCAVAAVFFEKFKKSTLMQRMMVGVRPACLGLIVAVLMSLSLTNYFDDGQIMPAAVALGVVDFVLLYKFKWDVPKIIILSAVVGLILF